jgi:uncharacterized membrane protein
MALPCGSRLSLSIFYSTAKESIMNKFTLAAILATSLLAGPITSYAQSNAPQSADTKVTARHDGSYGGVAQGTSASGMKKHTRMHSSCVGPVSFCNIYFGS